MGFSYLDVLSKRGLSLLRLDSEEWDALEDTRHAGRRFTLTFPHEIARGARRHSVALIEISGSSPQLRVSFVRSVQAIGTLDSRMSFDFVEALSATTLTAILREIADSSLRISMRRLVESQERVQPVAVKLSMRILQVIDRDPTGSVVLKRAFALVSRPKRFENATALQHDALALALRAFGATDQAVRLSLGHVPTALNVVRLQEDAVIEHDAKWIPGWHLDQSDLTGHAVFSKGDQQLEIFTANKLPLEELLGVDLIYFNQNRGSIVMVQYKMMERADRIIRTGLGTTGNDDDEDDDDVEWLVRIDNKFIDEMNRMKSFDNDCDPDGAYRLNSSAFFFKLVKRSASVDSVGVILSLGHVDRLIGSGQCKGPRRGLRINYRMLDGHYLRGGTFVELIRSGYVGTRGVTTDHLQVLIDATLRGGRGAVAAIKRSTGRR
jgi:hypothetical protein